MASYRGHVGFAASLGVAYAAMANVATGLHWLYGSVAALLTTLGGLLPDLDSDSGVELRGFTGILGVLTAMAVWQDLQRQAPGLPFEALVWASIAAFLLIRHGLRRAIARFTVHRGICHSLPAALFCAAATERLYPSPYPPIRLAMGLAVGLGFLSHLLLDELSSVDLKGRRVNKAFGTALKLTGPSAFATLALYAAAGLLAYRAWQEWPAGLSPVASPPALSLPPPAGP